ncbi:MAG: hypothetical protein SF051_06220 [Elusimicrobiota bacterium]|nr:hypothetical protein [Elusimicrobiota bacterium]
MPSKDKKDERKTVASHRKASTPIRLGEIGGDDFVAVEVSGGVAPGAGGRAQAVQEQERLSCAGAADIGHQSTGNARFILS